MTFRIGQRVRTTVDAPTAPGFEHFARAGTPGTVMCLPFGEGGDYGVVLDTDPYGLLAIYGADELVALDS